MQVVETELQVDAQPVADVEALKRVKTSYYFRKSSRENAYRQIRDVLGIKEEKNANGLNGNDKSYDAILLKTCQLIGQYERISFVPGFANAIDSWTPLKKILRASNIRARQIRLHRDWWKSDHGHLLAFKNDGKSPLALIRKGEKYLMVDAMTGKEEVINAANSKIMSEITYSFFTPLPKGKLSAKDLLKFALVFTKKDVVYFLVLGVISAALALLIPISSGYIFNVIVPGGEKSDLYQIGLMVLSLALVLGTIDFVKAIAVLRFEGISSFKLQSAVWDRILSLKVPFFSRYDAGNLAERSLGIEKIRTILSANVMAAIVAAIFSIFYLALMLYYDVRLALLALLLGAAVAAFTLTISMLAYKHVAATMRMEAIISGFMMMMIDGIRKIRLTASGDKVFNIWADKFSQQKIHYTAKQKLLIVASIFTYGFPILASVFIYLRIHQLLLLPGSEFQIGDFIAFNTAYLSFQGALISAFMVTVPVMSIKPTFQLLLPVLEAEMEDYDNKKDPGILKGQIEVTGLNFKYADAPDLILKNVNLKINPGEFVALVGGSGSGKSTLLRILLGFEQYTSGSVLYDGLDLKDIDIRTIRDQMGVVLQGGKIMQGTVLYNIIGTTNYTEAQAWEAARIAGCDQDIEGLENKMNTYLPPGGGTLSGGQQQRIVIARALIRNPKIILFDEATSALDNDTQKTVMENLSKMKVTKIVIAHRLSTIRDADKIVVMDKGNIVEAGNYNSLIQREGYFYNLVKNQVN
ncbi:MAG: NHLP bacteriocin export ABC transporter permease/ATPase subunit [Saprospiraceae bacterium]|nr:NHLP bacteriocin export ABC transporter permease/ATPase subunit [Saprospiraceae bacterium]